jgi:hypothetical protein
MGAASHVAGSTSDDHHAIRTFLRHFPVFIKSGPLPRPPRPHPLWDAKKSFPGNHSRDLQLTFFFLPTKWTTRAGDLGTTAVEGTSQAPAALLAGR